MYSRNKWGLEIDTWVEKPCMMDFSEFESDAYDSRRDNCHACVGALPPDPTGGQHGTCMQQAFSRRRG